MSKRLRAAVGGALVLGGAVLMVNCVGPATASPAQVKPLDAMTAGELWEYGRDLDFRDGKNQERVCEGNRKCEGEVDAAKSVEPSWSTPTPQGRIVARLTNKGNDRVWPIPNVDLGIDTMYKLKFDNGRRAYYLVEYNADGQENAGWRWKILEAEKGSEARADSVAGGRWVRCTLPHTHPTPGKKGQFARCAQDTSGAAIQAAILDEHTSPTWLSCSGGCCTAGQ